jgi:3-oxoacyl-[acyl-carrier-protein] synthase III
MDFGLVAFGTALGIPMPLAEVVGEYAEDVERIIAYGYRNVLRCPPEVGLTDLAVGAGQQALETAGVDPADLDLVVLAITDITEYLYWDAAASVTSRLGACRAEAVLLTQACTTGVLSLDTVAGKLATHPGYDQALVIAASRCCEPYWNRLDTQPMAFSDGAAAAVARRGHPRLRWLTTEVQTDGRYADFYRLPAGGAAVPFGAGEISPADIRAADAWSIMDFFDYDAGRFEQFVAELDKRTRLTVAAACARAGMETADLARVILLSDNASALTALAGKLGVPLSRTNLDLALEYGHLGAADQLFCLSQYWNSGGLEPGARVALVSRGRGMHWACTLIEV